MAEIISLTTRRGQLKGQLTRFGSYIKENKDNIDMEQLAHRKEKMKIIWDDFEKVQAQIEEQKGVSVESENYRSEFEELYFKNVAECDKVIKNASIHFSNFDHTDDSRGIINNSNSFAHSCNNHCVPPSIKLAALEIPTFAGDYTE